MSEVDLGRIELVSRPGAICCPECGRVIELVEEGCNYPCERCGVLWRWYYRPGMLECLVAVWVLIALEII